MPSASLRVPLVLAPRGGGLRVSNTSTKSKASPAQSTVTEKRKGSRYDSSDTARVPASSGRIRRTFSASPNPLSPVPGTLRSASTDHLPLRAKDGVAEAAGEADVQITRHRVVHECDQVLNHHSLLTLSSNFLEIRAQVENVSTGVVVGMLLTCL